MELKEYTEKALLTAEPRAFDLKYLLPGIAGEVGEIFAEFAKEHWHGTDRSAGKVDELGDVAWLTAVLIHSLQADTSMDRRRPAPLNSSHEALEALLWHASTLLGSPRDVLPIRALRMWDLLEVAAPAITGKPLQESLETNIEKLAERAENNSLRSHT